MKLSVVTVCYNDLEALKKTIQSVLDQRSEEFELIIQDGGSTDGTVEYLNALNENRFHAKSERDRGIYDGMNRGVQRSCGEYVYFLNAGDVFMDTEVVSDLIAVLSSNPDLVYSKVLCVSEGFQMIKGGPVGKRDFRFGMPVSHQGLIYRKKDLIKYPYDTRYRIIADMKATKSIVAECDAPVFLNRTICRFDLGGISSTRHFSMMKERMRLAIEDRDCPALAHCLLFEYPKYSFIWILRKLRIYDWVNRIRFRNMKAR